MLPIAFCCARWALATALSTSCCLTILPRWIRQHQANDSPKWGMLAPQVLQSYPRPAKLAEAVIISTQRQLYRALAGYQVGAVCMGALLSSDGPPVIYRVQAMSMPNV